MKHIKYYFYILFLIIFTISCTKDKVDLNKTSNTIFWNPGLGIPLSYASISMKEMLETLGSKGTIGIETDGGIYFTYSKNLFSQTGGAKNKIGDQSFPLEITQSKLNIPIFPPGATNTIIPLDSLPLKIDNSAEIDSIYFKNGQLSISTSSSFPKASSITITFPKITKNGIPLSTTMEYIGTENATHTFDLTDCRMILVNKKIPITASISFNIAATTTLSGNEKINFTIDISNTTFRILYGYLGNVQLLNDTTAQNKLVLFSDNNTNGVEIANPNIYILIKNSYGMPIELKLDSTRTYSASTKSYFDLRFYSTTNNVNPHLIKHPLLTQVGQSIIDTIVYNNTNCNIDSVMSTAPQFFYYGIKAKSNPNGKTSIPNFVTDTSKLTVDVQIKIPLNLKAKSLILTDTIALDFGNAVSDFSIIEKLAIYTTFNSYMPFDIKLQVYLMDEVYNIVDSLYDATSQPIVKSGTINTTTGKITEPVKKISGSIFDSERAKKLQIVKHAIVKADLSTYNGGTTFVKITNDFKLDIAFQIQTKLQVRNFNQL